MDATASVCGKWRVHPSPASNEVQEYRDGTWLPVADAYGHDAETIQARRHLIAAAPDLLIEADVLRCLASSPRFQDMKVRNALAELAANGCGHDDGAAIRRARGEKRIDVDKGE